MKFRKKPTVLEGIQWTGDNLFDVISFTDGAPDIRGMHAGEKWEDYCRLVRTDGLKIFTLEGSLIAPVGHWILKGDKGECWPVRPDYFADNYEAVE
ncbi:hypothetical protein ACQKDL_12925 [Pseudomonas bubulae]|uniref:hypothetical protein n=1 Tax=Pseudomonas bubulae TaxID=2316085 RepID=UPI003D07677F